MQLASEFLAEIPSPPLSASLVVRPVRACVFVPEIESIPWQRIVEHAFAAQTGVWGGGHNLVVPTGWDLVEDEMFWRLVERFDPDIIALHIPTYGDVETLAPDAHRRTIERLDRELLAQGFGEETRARELEGLKDRSFWDWDLSDEFQAQLIERLAPLRHGDDPRIVHLDGTAPAPYPLTDASALQQSPPRLLDLQTDLGDTERLMLTHQVGRLLGSLRSRLAARGVEFNDILIQQRQILLRHAWTQRIADDDFAYPRMLAETGLARRLPVGRGPERAVVVVGDSPRDFLLSHGLARIRPNVFWCPGEYLGDDAFLRDLANQLERAFRGTGDPHVAIVSPGSADAARVLLEWLVAHPTAHPAEPELAEWHEVISNFSVQAADAQSERRVSLLLHEGQTQELPTPVPVSVSTSPNEFAQLRWMVDVEVQGWTPAKHKSLGADLLRGSMLTEHDVRTSIGGPSYFGQSALVQAFLGLEGSTARPQLRPRPLGGQIEAILRPEGWDVSVSDKGLFATRTAAQFGGLVELAEVLRAPDARAALDAYMKPGQEDRPGLYLTDTRRCYLSLAEIEAVVGGPDVAALVGDLYERGVLIRGHVLKCDYCRSASFYSLTPEQRFRCGRCETDQRATRASWLGDPEPVFRYALSEVVFLFLQNNGHVPLLAAHDHFVVGRGRERQSFDVAFEMNLTSADGTRREHDIVASWGAELWLGEATIQSKLAATKARELERLTRLRESAVALSARGLLFVTTAEAFNPQTSGRIETTFGRGTDRFEVVVVPGFDAGAAAV